MKALLNGYSTDNLISVLVEITTYCNLGCAGCIRTITNNNNAWMNHHISLDDFQHIVDSLPPVGEIVTQGIGEPTMHPQLPEIIRIARQAEKFDLITFTTNAMIRDLDYFTNLFDLGLSRLYISVDSLEPVLANKLREGTKVERLNTFIPQLTEAFPGKIAIRTVVGSENIQTIPHLLNGLNELGPLEVLMHPYDDIGYPVGTLTLEERKAFEKEMEPLTHAYDNLVVATNGFLPSDDVCIHPWRIPAITADGYLVPCCRVMDKNLYTFGNILSSSFSDVWESSEAYEMRTSFLHESPNFCEGCTRYSFRGGCGSQGAS